MEIGFSEVSWTARSCSGFGFTLPSCWKWSPSRITHLLSTLYESLPPLMSVLLFLRAKYVHEHVGQAKIHPCPVSCLWAISRSFQRMRIRNRTNQKAFYILPQLLAISCLEDFPNEGLPKYHHANNPPWTSCQYYISFFWTPNILGNEVHKIIMPCMTKVCFKFPVWLYHRNPLRSCIVRNNALVTH